MKLRITIRYLILTALALIFAAISSHARAAYVLTLQQTAGNVVATGSGSFNLAALTLNDAGDVGVAANFFPSLAQAIVGVPSTSTDLYQGISGPGSFGSGSSIEFASSAGGNVSGVDDAQILFVPAGYTSGALLSGSATWDSATFSSLGITPGTYTWTWGSGATADSFTMNVSTGAVPEPSTWVMLLSGAGVLIYFRSRRGR
jgi:hypothetical protein